MRFQAPAQFGNQPSMKISEIKTFLVGSTRGEQEETGNISGRNWVYVKILTDQGIHGIGEAYSCSPDEATVKLVEHYSRWLVGQDPSNIQYLWDYMYNGMIVVAVLPIIAPESGKRPPPGTKRPVPKPIATIGAPDEPDSLLAEPDDKRLYDADAGAIPYRAPEQLPLNSPPKPYRLCRTKAIERSIEQLP